MNAPGTSSSCWPIDDELGRKILEREGASESEIEWIMWRNAADLYKFDDDELDRRKQLAASAA